MTYAYQVATDYGFENVLYEDSGLSIPFVEAERLEPGTYYLKVTATNESGYTTDCFDYYSLSNRGKVYGCYQFIVYEDGTITYEAEVDV